MLSRISYLGGWKIWGRKCYLECEKFGVENAISNLEFGGVENLGCKMLSRISNLGVENLGRKMLSRISNLGGGKFGMQNAISNLGGGKFGAENAISNLQFGWVEDLGWKIHPNWRFEIAFSAPNFPPPNSR